MNDEEKNEFEKIKIEIKAEIEQIRGEYKNAKKILQDITSFGNDFQSLRTLLNDENNGIQVNYSVTKTKKEQIESYATLAHDLVSGITDKLQKVEANIVSMQAAYSEFTEIKGKILGISGEIEILLTASRGLHEDISVTKKEALNTLESIKNIYQTVAENVKDMQAAYQEFL